MAWQRKIPFGYRMRRGETVVEPMEAEAVREIFSLYIEGASLNGIAGEMTRRGIRYHERAEHWNKNMVHRILDNERYLGGDEFPRIVDSEAYLAAQLRKKDSNTYAPVPREIGPIREKTVCALCGARMTRDTKARGKARWKCRNKNCGQALVLSDNAVAAAVDRNLEALARTPELLWMRKPPEGKMSIDALKILNKLPVAFNRGSDSEYIRTLIFAGAAEKYKVIPDMTLKRRMDGLRERAEKGEHGSEMKKDLLATAVRAIRIGGEDIAALELVNGEEVRGA